MIIVHICYSKQNSVPTSPPHTKFRFNKMIPIIIFTSIAISKWLVETISMWNRQLGLQICMYAIQKGFFVPEKLGFKCDI